MMNKDVNERIDNMENAYLQLNNDIKSELKEMRKLIENKKDITPMDRRVQIIIAIGGIVAGLGGTIAAITGVLTYLSIK